MSLDLKKLRKDLEDVLHDENIPYHERQEMIRDIRDDIREAEAAMKKEKWTVIYTDNLWTRPFDTSLFARIVWQALFNCVREDASLLAYMDNMLIDYDLLKGWFEKSIAVDTEHMGEATCFWKAHDAGTIFGTDLQLQGLWPYYKIHRKLNFKEGYDTITITRIDEDS